MIGKGTFIDTSVSDKHMQLGGMGMHGSDGERGGGGNRADLRDKIQQKRISSYYT